MTRLDLGVFFDRTPSALVVLDRELRYVAANAAYLSKTGSTLDEIVGRSVFADLERDRVELVRASLERVLSTRKPDGASTVRYVPLLDAAGDVELIVQESQDVRGEPVAFARTDLDGAEAELRFIIESIPVQVWTATPDGQLDYVSDRVVTYFQTTAAEILGNGWLSVLHPDDAETCVKRWTHSLTTGEPYEVEFRLRRGDGEYRWHLGRAAAHRGPDGGVLRWFGTNTDVHDAKLAVAELRVRSEYEQRLIGIVSHDLRNPLNAIALGVSLLATSDLDDHAAKTLARVTRSADRATRLITDLLDFAKARIGTTIPINPRPTPMNFR
jgi:PAS domain S-box-containing protein